jgi:predicted DNA-binding helix-hairpin-helix protein
MNLKINLDINQREAKFEEDPLDCFIYRSTYQPILKILLTNKCQKDCAYCINNCKTNYPRYQLDPLKLSKEFISMYKEKKVRGLFLSSAIYKDSNLSQEKILETLIILRKKFNYSGYLHAKVLPNTDFSLIKELFKYADRLSINLELPAQKYLSSVSSKNLFEDLMKRLRFLTKLNKERRLKSGITTQFVVGALKEKDVEILNLTQYLYQNLNLKMVHYSGFKPIKGTPLENKQEVDPLRIKRLYEASILLRDYGFKYREFLYDKEGNLTLDAPIKELAAMKNKKIFPINVNKADYFLLLRIPLIGKTKATKILTLRKEKKIVSFKDLEKIGISKKVEKWICF